MDPEEQRIAAEEERLRALAGGGGEPPAEGDDEMSTSTVPTDDTTPTDDDIRAANEAGGGTPNGDPPVDEPADPPVDDEDPATAAPAPVRGQSAFERRISQLAAKNRAKDAEIAARDAEILRLQAGGDPPANDDGALSPTTPQTRAQFDAAVRAESTRLAAVAAFNEKCNAVEEKGAKLGARWVAAKNNLALLDDNGSIPMDLLAPALETENPHRIIMMLGEDPDRAAELLAMNPNKRAVEIAKMDLTEGRTPPPPPRRSAAPPPPDPIRGRTPVGSASATPSDKDSDAEWLRKRNLQLAAKKAAQG